MPRSSVQTIRASLAKHIHGKPDAVDAIITCLIAGGHVLIEDIPGVGKTTLAYVLSRSIQCDFNRIQFTSDIIPSDILGVSIYQKAEGAFRFYQGPIFANIVIADEINRAAPKSQSALLEAMERGLVSSDGNTYRIDPPFMVVATQNPVDYESTFPLPNAQLDRFLMRISMGYPAREAEGRMLRSGALHYDRMDIQPVVEKQEILTLQKQVGDVFIEESIYEQIQDVVERSRSHPSVELGVSPRGALAFKTALQAAALVEGRDFVSPADVERYAGPCLAHRLLMRSRPGIDLDWKSAASVIEEILQAHTLPHQRD